MITAAAAQAAVAAAGVVGGCWDFAAVAVLLLVGGVDDHGAVIADHDNRSHVEGRFCWVLL